MRLLPAIVLLALAASAAEPPATPTWPLWDGSESVEQYARRANLEATRTLDLGNGVKLEMVLIPAGKFVMGTEEPESRWIGGAILAVGGLVALVMIAVPLVRAIHQRRRPQFSLRWLVLLVVVLGVAQYGGVRWWRAVEARREYYHDNSPAHVVTITQPFYLGRYEVTQEQYQQVMGANPSAFKGRDLPVECFVWDEAQEFCKEASEKTGQAVRLPTEADLDRAAWYKRNSNKTTHPVGLKAPNTWGVYDMHGNVFEWCADRYGDYSAEAVTDPPGPAQGQCRVLCGGCWLFSPRGCRSAVRLCNLPDIRSEDEGFRVLVSVPPRPP